MIKNRLVLVPLLAALLGVACNQSRDARSPLAAGDAQDAIFTPGDAAQGDAAVDDATASDALDARPGFDLGIPDERPSDAGDAAPPPDTPPPDAVADDAVVDDAVADDATDAPTDADTRDATPDTGTPPEAWVAYAGQSSNRENIQLVPLDGSGWPITIYESSASLSRVRFMPDGEVLVFLETPEDGRPSLVSLPLDSLEPEHDPLDAFAQVLAVGPTALEGMVWISGSRPGDPVIRIYGYDRVRRSILYFSEPAAGTQHRALVEMGFGAVTLSVTPPDTATLLYDGFGGLEPTRLTEGVDIRDDVALWPNRPEGAVLFTDRERRLCWIELFPSDPIATPFTDATCLENTEEFHPRPTPDGCCVVSSRYRPEVSTRPSPRDIVLVDIATGEVVRNLTDSPLTSERWPDVQPRP